MDKNIIRAAESFLNESIKDENIITLNWKISKNGGAKKSRLNEINYIARKMQRKLPKENFIIYIKGSNTTFFHIYDSEEDLFFGIPLCDEVKLIKRANWRRDKRTYKKPKKKNY